MAAPSPINRPLWLPFSSGRFEEGRTWVCDGFVVARAAGGHEAPALRIVAGGVDAVEGDDAAVLQIDHGEGAAVGIAAQDRPVMAG